ncbi:hypothetical protein [Merismopedia glauca]|nr:hypothetical protein [Merismopedia glauca]
MNRKPTLLMNSMFNIFPQNPQDNLRIEPRNSQSEITQDIYNSISTGMSYDEVLAIIGWEGILIYERDIGSAGGRIREKIYQWNDQDVYFTDYRSQKVGQINPYWIVTLQFQNDILINKSALNLQR